MSRGTSHSPYQLELEEEEGVAQSIEEDIDYLNIDDSPDSDESDIEEIPVILIDDVDDDNASASTTQRSSRKSQRRASKPVKIGPVTPPDVEVRSCNLPCGKIRAGHTVELKDTIEHADETLMHSGDFLRVKQIIRNNVTGETRLRGLRMRRVKYLAPLIDLKFNDLVMVLHVTEDDRRCSFIQGMSEVPVTSVIRKRRCVITSKSYEVLNFRHDVDQAAINTVTKAMGKQDLKRLMFTDATLTCRYVYIQTINDSGKSYGGILRGIYQREADDSPNHATPTPSARLSDKQFRSVTHRAEEANEVTMMDEKRSQQSGKRRARSDSLEELDGPPPKRQPKMPTKPAKFTFGDAFCGVGGASEGAFQAGLFVKWGLDFNEPALRAYKCNHPTCKTLYMSAHNLKDYKDRKFLRVDILHLSPPCQYWSPNKTREGQNDQANYEALWTVGPILELVKPRVFTIEQTYGLMTKTKHNREFRNLLNMILNAGYDVRYKLEDLSVLGVPQRRKRLLMIGAKRGQPLPAVPSPTHGPNGSGLKRFHSVNDALVPLRRLGPMRQGSDIYHQPFWPSNFRQKPYDPENSFLPGCITTNGGESWHSSGKRRHTVREASLCQTFPYTYKFYGGTTEAMRQVGNAFPPVVTKAMYTQIAKTLEAFDNGIIDAEDDVCDVDMALDLLDIDVPGAGTEDSPIDLMNPVLTPKASVFKYLTRSPAQSRPTTPLKRNKLFGTGNAIEPVPQSSEQKRNRFREKTLFGGFREEMESPSPRQGLGRSVSLPIREKRERLVLTEKKKAWIERTSG